LNMFAGNVGSTISDRSYGAGARQAKKMVNGLDAKMKKQRKELVNIGAMAGDGMVAGLRSKVDDWVATVRSMVAATKAELEIRSPSRVFMRIGEQTGEGFTQGFAAAASTKIPVPNMVTPTAPSFRVNSDSLTGAETAPPMVKVFIGDKELTDIVDVQVEKNTLLGRDFAYAGRRDY